MHCPTPCLALAVPRQPTCLPISTSHTAVGFCAPPSFHILWSEASQPVSRIRLRVQEWGVIHACTSWTRVLVFCWPCAHGGHSLASLLSPRPTHTRVCTSDVVASTCSFLHTRTTHTPLPSCPHLPHPSLSHTHTTLTLLSHTSLLHHSYTLPK